MVHLFDPFGRNSSSGVNQAAGALPREELHTTFWLGIQGGAQGSHMKTDWTICLEL